MSFRLCGSSNVHVQSIKLILQLQLTFAHLRPFAQSRRTLTQTPVSHRAVAAAPPRPASSPSHGQPMTQTALGRVSFPAVGARTHASFSAKRARPHSVLEPARCCCFCSSLTFSALSLARAIAPSPCSFSLSTDRLIWTKRSVNCFRCGRRAWTLVVVRNGFLPVFDMKGKILPC
jgi:hypothetical protein